MNTEMPKTKKQFQKPTENSAAIVLLCLHFQTPPTPDETIFTTSIFTFFEEKHNMVRMNFTQKFYI